MDQQTVLKMMGETPLELLDAQGGKHLWTLPLLDAQEGLDLGFSLWEIAGQSIGELMGSARNVGDLQVVDGSALGRAFAGIAIQVSKRGGSKFIHRLLKGCKRDGMKLLGPDERTSSNRDEAARQLVFKNIFRGNYGELVALVAEVLKHNFASFFAASAPSGSGSLSDVFRKISKLFTEGPESPDEEEIGSGTSGSSEGDEQTTW